SGSIRKTGAGTLVMTDTFNGQSGYKKTYSGGTRIDEGTLRLAVTGQVGTGAVTVSEGARFEIASGVTVSNQVDGPGTLYLENGVTLAIGNGPWRMGAVEFASGAAVTLTIPSGMSAPFAILTGVDAADLSRFTLAGNTLSVINGVLALPSDATGAYVWAGADGGDWATPGNWRVDGAVPATAPGSGDTILFEDVSAATVGGTGTLTVTKVITCTDGGVTFNCPVAFAGTYLVECLVRAPTFAGGATAIRPDDSLSGMGGASRVLSGNLTFTQNWTIPQQQNGYPFVVAENSTVTGKNLAGTTNTPLSLVVSEGAVATFDSIAIAGKLDFKLAGGRLVANGDITVGANGTPRNFGSSSGNIGTVEANGIYKNVTGHGQIDVYVTNFVVGAGGFGMKRKDYSFKMFADARLTAKDDLTIYEPARTDSGAPKDDDWGLNFNSHTFTVDTGNHTVTFDSFTSPNASKLVKEGVGEMIMQNRQKKHSGGTVVKAGTLTVSTSGAQGYGPLTVNGGATLAYTVVIGHPYPLTLGAGTLLKPAQNAYFDVSGGSLNLPAEGTVVVDMTGFTFVNGVPIPILSGAAAGDEAKFTALLPAGVSGAFSVSGGVLNFTPTAGGGAAADLFWHPTGESVWSDAVAAWTNAAGEQVAFTPYAKVTVADAATISLPADVEASDVAISADGDVTLNGAGKLGGAGSIVKTGSGTFTFNATGGLDAQPLLVSNGVFRMGADLSGPLGSTADAAPIVVADGATLDVNFSNSDPANAARSMVTREKLVRVSGEGVDGQGAIVNDAYNTYYTFSDMVLDDDATMGGSKRFDVRGVSGYVRSSGSITGPGKTLTVKNTSNFGIVNATVDLKAIVVTNGARVRVEGNSTKWKIDEGIRMYGGGISSYQNFIYPANLAIRVESGANTITMDGGGVTTNNSTITVAPGATLTQTAGDIIYNGTVNGTISMTGGNMYLGSAPMAGLTLAGSKSSGTVMLRGGGTFSGANVTCANFGISDLANASVAATFLDSTFDVSNFYIGWGSPFVKGGTVSIGEGTTLTVSKIAIGDSGTNVYDNVKSVLSVDGGTIHHTNTLFYIGYSSPRAEFVLNAGTVTVDKAQILLHANTATNFAYLGGHSTSVFRQNGGTFNYGGAGFLSNEFEDNTEDGFLVFKGGTFNATANWSIPYFMPLSFKDGAAGGWTLNQTDGTTATWTTALFGDADVTLNGAATLVGTNEIQGAVGGKWTVGDGFTAGLEGAASLLGGLDLGEGASATVDIAANRSAVFTARDGGDEFGKEGCITSRFNRVIGGTTRGTITHDETFLLTKPAAANRPFGNRNHQAAYAVGQFYVEPEKAGKWYFKGYSDDYILLEIDGEMVLSSIGGAKCATRYGTNELAAGWHTFRQVSVDLGGDFGGVPTMAYNTNGSSTYTPFSVHTVKMRPAADRGAGDNANTVRWSHYKGTEATVGNSSTSPALWNGDFDWDFRCITNNLQMIQGKGGASSAQAPYMNGYTVNRFEGWFLVTEENADKEWTFRSQYDDRCGLWLDGVDTGLTGTSGNTLTYKVTLARGWHSFRIQIADFAGDAGPWDTSKPAISYQVANGAQTQFSEQTLQLTVCPDGYVQGGVTLASGARLANGAAENAAVIYGDVAATGTYATISGPFKFEGGTLAFRNVAPNTADLANVLAFSNAAVDMLANVGAITVDYADKPTRGRIPVCPLYGLTEEAAKAKVAVTVAGAPVDNIQVKVENGTITLRNTSGTLLYFR
ncbi:MAG: autotransporter-associated beta strand repeat-containing protein, partial [Kiritimatiellae bacterium]|nr:autotransporter-associated beta strand repeat-containing protein [Kiritimatiellia bacterium]